jgi:hypothetical protein
MQTPLAVYYLCQYQEFFLENCQSGVEVSNFEQAAAQKENLL